ncbi:hypothetical protein OH491_13465 [Termitidicoccus mucosus]|uniref:Tip attachment protein J domain-containing protein n=1 Tax=Termitidicoccus mucosus TaxID=1184151 RepID=A0A178IJC7_9BACT|nr:hypothetical protein AW736_13975 [Opitutaceae bacterium TSB47]
MGSGKGGGGSSSYNYYGTIVGALCLGPSDEIYGIEVDDELKWEGSLSRSSSPNPVAVDVPDYGTIIFRWGLDTQLETDPVLFAENNTLGHRHPAYTGICYAILKDFLFGQERTTAPTVRFYIRRAPRQAIVAGEAAQLTDGQANVIAIIAELLTSDAGLGWTADMIDLPSFQAAAEIAQARNALTSVSLVLTKQAAAKAAITDLLAMVDGYPRPNRLTGKLEIGIWTPPEEIDVESLPVIDEAALNGRPKSKIETWDDVVTRWRCTYNDRTKNFKERSVKYDDPRARYAAGTKRPETLRRNLITRHAQAVSHLQAHAQRRGTPGAERTLSVRAARYDGLQVGDHVRVDIDPEPGGLQRLQVCRVLEITRREAGDEMQLKLEAERTLAPVTVLPPDDPLGPPAPPTPVPDIVYARFFSVPPSLAEGKANCVGILASRPGGMVTGYRIFFDKNSDDLFPRIGGTRSFALRGRLHAALADEDGDTTVSVEILDTFGDEIISENPGAVAASDDALLAIIIKPGVEAEPQSAPAGGGIMPFTINPPPPVVIVDDFGTGEDDAGIPWLEVCSCVEFVASAPGVLDVTVLRGRQGTAMREFVAGDEVWFIRRDQLAVVEHADFAELAATLDPVYFKLQPAEPARLRPLEDCAPRPFTFGLTSYEIPAGEFGLLVLDPPMGSFSGTLQVRVAAAGWQEVHYTLDGSDVTVESPDWPVESLWGIDEDAPRLPLTLDRSCRLRARGFERKPVSRATGRFTGRSTPEVEGYYTSGATTVPAVAHGVSYPGNVISYALRCTDTAATIHYRVHGYVKPGWQWQFKTAGGNVTVTSPGVLTTGWYTLPAGYSGEAFSTQGRWWLRVQAYATRSGYTDSITTDHYTNAFGGPKSPPTWPS